MKIVIVGSLNMDLVVRMPRIPKPGETLLGGIFSTIPGGKGANQAVAAARLGAHVSMVGCVGSDAFGEEMRSALAAEGIDMSHVLVIPQEATGVALIQVDERGQNSISVASGANFRLTASHVEESLRALGDFDALVMPLETPLDTIYAGARFASEKGAKVLLNPAPAQPLESDLLELVDVLLPNEHEIGLMTGTAVQSRDEIIPAAEKLLFQGVKNLVVTVGSQGALLWEGRTGDCVSIPAWPVQAVDTTAAGDCFVSAMAVGLCEGKSLRTAAEFASAAAAISVTRNGAQPSLPRRQEVEQFIRERTMPTR